MITASDTLPPGTKTCNFCGHHFWHFSECPKCRDQFAMAALNRLIINSSDINDFPKRTARNSYVIADAMLEVRKK